MGHSILEIFHTSFGVVVRLPGVGIGHRLWRILGTRHAKKHCRSCQQRILQRHLVLKWLDVGWVSRFVAAHPKVPQVAGKVIFKLRHRMYFGKHLTWFSSMFCGDQRSCALIATTVILSHCFRIPFTGKSGWLTYSNVDGSSLEMPCHEGIWHQCQPKPEWHLPGHVECSTGVHQHHFAHGQSAPPAVLLGHPCFPEDVSKSKPRC